MNDTQTIPARRSGVLRRHRGFTLVELMVSMVISLVILAALVSIFVNASRNSDEMAKTSGLIENGRFAMQLLEADIQHAGYWGGFIPQFDEINTDMIPGDVPAAVPEPCAAFNTWNLAYRTNLMGIPVQAGPDLPAPGPACLGFPARKLGTDVLLVRHAETCLPGVGNCAASVPGRVYLQTPFCSSQKTADLDQIPAGRTANSIRLVSPPASTVNDIYVGTTIRASGGAGAGQYGLITDYTGDTATFAPTWGVLPDDTTTYSFEYWLGTGAGPLTQRNCIAGVDQRRYVSNIYYITEIQHPDRPPGELIPTLVRSQFDLAGGVLAHQAPEPLIEGIEQFRVEIGIDETMNRCAPTAVNYAQAPDKVDPTTCLPSANTVRNTLRTNRGDGSPDRYKRCTAAAPCTAAELTNAVAVKLYLLVRSRDRTPAYTDTKTYCLGEPAADGSCPVANQVAAANDSYKRHVFVSSVRLVNVSGRRETP